MAATTFDWGEGTAHNITHLFHRGLTATTTPGLRWNEASAYFELQEATSGAAVWNRIHTIGTIPQPVARGDILRANVTPAWTRYALGGAGTILRSDGTDIVYSTATYPNTAAISTLLYASAADVISALATANNGLLKTSGTGVPSIGTIALLNGAQISDTAAGTVVLGDIIHGNATPAWARLAGNTTTTRKFLRQTGDGVASAVPAWDTILAADVPGSALTKGDDTNVTLTLGGSPTTALLNAASITAGWTGTLAVARGGTNSSTALNNNRAMVSSAGAVVEAAAMTNGQLLIGSTSAAPVVAAITAGTNVTVTNGAGSITIASSSAGGTLTFPLYFSPALATTGTADLTYGIYIGNDRWSSPTYECKDEVAITGGTWTLQVRTAAAGGGNVVAEVTGLTTSGLKTLTVTGVNVPSTDTTLYLRAVLTGGAGSLSHLSGVFITE